jgi:hypothetical protein
MSRLEIGMRNWLSYCSGRGLTRTIVVAILRIKRPFSLLLAVAISKLLKSLLKLAPG